MSQQRNPIYSQIGLLWAKREKEGGPIVRYTGRIIHACPIILKAGDIVVVDSHPNMKRGTMRLTIVKPVDQADQADGQTDDPGLEPIDPGAGELADTEGPGASDEG